MSAVDHSLSHLTRSYDSTSPSPPAPSRGPDRVAPARGLVVGVSLSALFWIVVGMLAWHLG